MNDAGAALPLVPGRECGACNVCCYALTIDDPELLKPQGYRCKNSRPDKSCAIYESRPQTCRRFYCGWRRLKWVRDGLRPDLSGVLIRLHGEMSAATGASTLGIAVTLLTEAALKAPGLAETVAAAVAARVPVYMNVPGPPGYTASQARINEVLEAAVAAADKAGVLDILRRARSKGRAGKHVPINLRRQTPPASDKDQATLDDTRTSPAHNVPNS
jgi:hypothetical protein